MQGFNRIFNIKKRLFPIYLFALCLHSMQVNSEELQDKDNIEYYQNNNTINQIPYFDNRFRIDAELDEVTLIFYRRSGSVPIILIRPDGSKIRINNFDTNKVEWFDDKTFDMIKIKKPMPGPWQAVGDILPDSKIFVVSEVKIEVNPLPEIVFSGETLKVEGRLFNGGQAIESPNFREVVKLDVNFYSTNNSSYENFGADAVKVTSFHDDGLGLDEYALDNIFTGEFTLNFAPGEWQPVYIVKLPMATRKLRQTTLMLYPTPIVIEVDISSSEEAPHKLKLTIDPTYVEPESLIFQGQVTFPDRQVEAFSIMNERGVTRTTEFAYTEPGIYRINLSAFGKTISGREFQLEIPEYSFNVVPEEAALLNSTVLNENSEQENSTLAIAEQARLEKQAMKQAQEVKEAKERETLFIIVASNIAIVFIALIVFFAIRNFKRTKIKKLSAKKT